MKGGKVSILIPVFNAEEFIDQTLESIINQTYPNFEIILVNDGSTDGSGEIIEKWADRHKSIICFHQENKGQCAAANVALENSSGGYIKFFDADDLMNEDHVALQMGRINDFEDCISSCEWGRFYNNDPASTIFQPEPVWKDLDSLEWIKQAMSMKADMMGAPLWLIPRKVIEKAGGWNERLSLNNDFEFSIRLLSNSRKVLFAKGAKMYYRSGLSNSLTSLKSENSYRAAILSTELGCNHLLSIDHSDEAKRLCANRFQLWVYRMYPDHKNLVKELEKKIADLGGSNNNCDGGRIFNLLSRFFGWKRAKVIQRKIYDLGWKELAKYNHRLSKTGS